MRYLKGNTDANHWLADILAKAEQESPLSEKELTFLLNLNEPDQLDRLFQSARKLRRRYFENRLFLYGFIYASTFCRNDCLFCHYRRSNTSGRRYRKPLNEIVAAAAQLAETGVHLIDLTMGEDPRWHDHASFQGDRLCTLVTSVTDAVDRPLMISPGLVPLDWLFRLKSSGATWYACYQETHNRRLFNHLRPGQDFNARMKVKTAARQAGFLVEEGMLCGVGETVFDTVHSIETMKTLDADQVRVMKFIPQKGTPMAGPSRLKSPLDSLVTGVLRLVFPDRLIPVSLDVDGIAGLKKGLDAGANVVTSIVPPGQGLSGVARHSLNIEDGNRTSRAVMGAVSAWGLETASQDEYLQWIERRRESSLFTKTDRKVDCGF